MGKEIMIMRWRGWITSRRSGLFIDALRGKTFVALALGVALAGLQPVSARGGELEDAIEVLQDEDKSKESKLAALEVVRKRGKAAAAAAPAIGKSLGSTNEQLRKAAYGALETLGEAAVPVLVEALAKKGMRVAAAESLGRIGAEAKKALPPLLEGMQLGFALSARDRATGGDQTQMLMEQRDYVRAAATAAAKIGPDAETYVPAVRKLLQQFAASPLIGFDSAIPAIQGLGTLEEGAKDAIPDLVKLLATAEGVTDKNQKAAYAKVVPAAIATLGMLGAPAEPALPALRRYLDDDKHGKAAEDAIARIKKSKKSEPKIEAR